MTHSNPCSSKDIKGNSSNNTSSSSSSTLDILLASRSPARSLHAPVQKLRSKDRSTKCMTLWISSSSSSSSYTSKCQIRTCPRAPSCCPQPSPRAHMATHSCKLLIMQLSRDLWQMLTCTVRRCVEWSSSSSSSSGRKSRGGSVRSSSSSRNWRNWASTGMSNNNSSRGCSSC